MNSFSQWIISLKICLLKKCLFSNWKTHIVLLWVYLIEKKIQGHVLVVFFKLKIPSMSAFTSSKVLHINDREEKEIWGKNHFDVKLSKIYCLKTLFFLILKHIFGLFSLDGWTAIMWKWGWAEECFFQKGNVVGKTQTGAGRQWTRFSSHSVGLRKILGEPGLLVWTLLSLPVNWEQLVKMFRHDGQHRHNYINPCVEDLRHVKCFPIYYLIFLKSL